MTIFRARSHGRATLSQATSCNGNMGRHPSKRACSDIRVRVKSFNSELRSTCEAALKEARFMVENRPNQIQYDFYL